MKTIRLGTRKSRLAMWQTAHVASLLKAHDSQIQVEIVPIVTLGDRITDRPLSELGGTAVFTKEIEAALLDGKCDVAVHSLKDLATVMPDGLELAAYLKREDFRDVFVSASGVSLRDLPKGSVIGTSSLRRIAMVRHFRPDLQVTSLRGNVPTRLLAVGKDVPDAKPYSGPALAGTIMAAAGLKRLGFRGYVTDYLPTDLFLPAPGQGVIALQTRADDTGIMTAVKALECTRTRTAAVAERTFLNVVEGGCRLPIGAFCMYSDTSIELCGVILSLDGEKVVTGRYEGTDPLAVGRALAEQLLNNGGADILAQVNQTLDKG
ncbi:MAG: hydroxymethylbilane synthase [Deltaproteobacteria bacterium]|nr:hydroxymethylbilane synthase [Deltaproteobacteria bacterium]